MSGRDKKKEYDLTLANSTPLLQQVTTLKPISFAHMNDCNFICACYVKPSYTFLMARLTRKVSPTNKR